MRPRRSHAAIASIALALLIGPLTATAASAAEPTVDPALVGLYGTADPTYDGVFRQSLGILGILAAGDEPSDDAVAWLLDQQCADGGFMAFNPDPSEPCVTADPTNFAGEDTNSTALAVQALTGIGADDEAQDALGFLSDARNDDGGWPYVPGGDSDPNSTGVVLTALSTDGDPVDQDAVDYVSSFQVGCDEAAEDQGGLASPYSGGAPDVLATVQAVPGVAGLSLLDGPASTGTWVDDAPAYACPVDNGDAQTVAGWGSAWLEAQVDDDAVTGGNAGLGDPELRLHPDGAGRGPEPLRGHRQRAGFRPEDEGSGRGQPRCADRRGPRRAGLGGPRRHHARGVRGRGRLRGPDSRNRDRAHGRPVTEPDPQPGWRVRRRRRAAGHRHEHRPDPGRGGCAPRAARHRARRRDTWPPQGGTASVMTTRRAAAAAVVVALAAAGVLLVAVPAEAVSSFRYWSYWHVPTHGTSWTYAGTGPAGYRVDDGAVEGWRFVVAVPNPSAPQPRTGAGSAFDAICGSTARPEGKDRVALVVDFGTAKDAPPNEARPGGVRGTCVVVDDRSTGLEVLAKAGYDPRRDSSGLLCGLSGFPASECGVVVKQTSPTPKPSPTKPRPTRSASAPSTSSPGVAPGSTSSPRLRPSSSAPPAEPGSASPATSAPTTPGSPD